MRPRSARWYQRPFMLAVSTLVMLIGFTLPTALPAWASFMHNRLINSLSYERQYGHWDVINLPADLRLDTIHATLLPTGKVLLVAGSGNNRDNFNAYQAGRISVLKTVLLDPITMTAKLIPTPSDFFCSGHANLASGNLLVAGGTSGYEVLAGNVTNPGGPMTIHNEDPNSRPRVLRKGTVFIAPNGKRYTSTEDVTVQPADKIDHGHGRVRIIHSTTTVFVQALESGKGSIINRQVQFTIAGLKGDDTHNIYGQGGPMTLNKQDFRGTNTAFEFNPWTEQYEQVGSMQFARWYPTLAHLPYGKGFPADGILAVSGLDNTGQILNGQNEVFNPQTKAWSTGPARYTATYPALILTAKGELFYSGSNAGYGPADKGRTPGIWNVRRNTFTPVSGLRDPALMETSATVLLPPLRGQNAVQSQRVMVLGGGGVGESNLSTKRTDIIDLASPHPHFTPGPDLAVPTRYPIAVDLPNDTVLITGGSSDYRGKHNSDYHVTRLYDPTSNVMGVAADEIVGRDYHSGAMLLPDGRVLVFGGNPLFSDQADTQTADFEQRLEIYTPPYLYSQRQRPVLNSGPMDVELGSKVTFTSPNPGAIVTARLIPPSSTTHVTNVEQRSVALTVTHRDDGVTLRVPQNPNLVSPGWYMLFVVNKAGVPSIARWVHVDF